MAHDSVTLKFRLSPSLSHKISLYAELKEMSVAEAAQEGLEDWFETIGAARLESAIDREIAEAIFFCGDELACERTIN